MRHQKKKGSLSRKVGPRKALYRGLATSFVLEGKLKSTEAKVKAIKPVIEKYITVSKEDTLANRRRLIAYFYDEKAVNRLLKELGPKYKERKGGYTRIIKLAERKGDNAKLALLELV
jgi:large subunit ribosomal protein L17